MSMTHKEEPAVARANDAAHNPRTKGYEFLGPPGALFVSTSVPFFTYVLSLQCSERAGGCPRSWVELPTEFNMAVTNPDWWRSLWDTEAFLVYFGWYAFCLIAWAILPGDWVEGQQMRNDKKLKYKINGKPILPTLALVFTLSTSLQPFPHICSLLALLSASLSISVLRHSRTSMITGSASSLQLSSTLSSRLSSGTRGLSGPVTYWPSEAIRATIFMMYVDWFALHV